MALPFSQCDPERLRRSLQDGLTESEQEALGLHLEDCESCRDDLERMAAATGFWGDARLLKSGPEPGSEDENLDRSEPAEAWLRLLDPPDPDGPECLGRLGVYEVSEVIGQGGMGVVLKARDPALDRMVAVKLLNPTLAHGPNARRRFAREARAAAAVAHEHIVAIYAVDEFRGLPYLVMQYIGGRSLQERLDATGPLTVPEILRVGTQAARALAAAHAQGVVHRDIKPANILLENCVERVKLTDFGLARAVDDASLTMSGVIAGTPQYMAPEQARGEPVDARSDLFSLGAVLYATAAGRPPFRADSAMAVLKRVCDDRHRPIREVNPEVPGWLAQIIDRLLAKAPEHRFATAFEVAELLERGLAHVQQPTLVEPPVLPGIVHADVRELDFDLPAAKPAPRSRRRLALAASLGLLAIGALGVSDAAGITQVTEYVATILRIKRPEGTLLVTVDDPGVQLSVDGDDLSITGAGPKEIRLKAGAHHVHATQDGRPIRDEVVTITRGGRQLVHIESHATGSASVVVAAPNTVETYRFGMTGRRRSSGQPSITGRSPFEVEPPTRNLHPGPIWSLAFTPDGKRLAIAQQAADRGLSVLRFWDLGRKADAIRFQEPSGFRSLALSCDGQSLAAVMADGGLKLWSIDGDNPRPIPWHNAEGQPGDTVAFLPDTHQPACALSDGRILYGNDPGKFLQCRGKVLCLAVSRDGKRLAFGNDAGTIRVHDVATGAQRFRLEDHEGPVESLDFSPDGKTLASASRDGTVRLWDLAKDGKARILAHLTTEFLAVRFSPDGETLACATGKHDAPQSASFPCEVQLWDWDENELEHVLKGHTNSIRALAFSPDGKTLATGSLDQTLRLWDADSGKLRDTFSPGLTPKVEPLRPTLAAPSPSFPGPPAAAPAPPVPPSAPLPPDVAANRTFLANQRFPRRRGLVWSLAFAPDGRRLAIGQQGTDGFPSLMRVWDLRTKRDMIWMTQPAAYRSLAFSSDGRVLAAGTLDGTLAVQENEGDVARPRSGYANNQGSPINALAFLPGTHHLAFGTGDGRVLIDHRQGIGPAEVEPKYPGKVFALAVSPDGKTLAVAGEAGDIVLHDAATGRTLDKYRLKGHEGPVESLDFSPDGKTLASAGRDRTVKLWDVRDRRLVGTLTHPENERLAVRFSPDGKTLAVADGRHDARTDEPFPCTVELWEPKSGKLRSTLSGHTGSIFALAFSPDGKVLASGSMDQTVRLWDAESGKLIDTIIPGETGTSADMGAVGTPGGVGAPVLPSASAPPVPIDPTRTAPPFAFTATAPSPDPHEGHAAANGLPSRPWPAPVVRLAYSRDGRRLAIAQEPIDGLPGALRLWDLAEKKQILAMAAPSPLRAISFWAEDELVTGAADGELKVWKLWGEHAHPENVSNQGSAVNAIVFLPKRRVPVYGLSDGRVLYWHGNGEDPKYHGRVLALAVDAQETTLAVAGDAGSIHLYDVKTGAFKSSLDGHHQPVVSLDFAPDGEHLASASWDRTVRVWDVKTGKVALRLGWEANEPLAVRFSPDGRWLAVADGRHDAKLGESFPCEVRLWDPATDKPRGTLQGHTASIEALTFSPDGKTLATGSLDQTVRLWDAATGKPLETIVPGEPRAAADPTRPAAESPAPSR